ncbi:hypothetical protein NAC44_06110 [Allorhizobium sp. BGMRC 0089]|uniref:hypothetical protein n=1 Tax=Allorhizobium sonneratiae TaxID=2934936 RepID=UPI0020347BBD|nr:hypothetical protein [Allorhizobium sonneratiae]MCM2291901.1 hypothetical protein [Allorhizobium sonneratiae]
MKFALTSADLTDALKRLAEEAVSRQQAKRQEAARLQMPEAAALPQMLQGAALPQARQKSDSKEQTA